MDGEDGLRLSPKGRPHRPLSLLDPRQLERLHTFLDLIDLLVKLVHLCLG